MNARRAEGVKLLLGETFCSGFVLQQAPTAWRLSQAFCTEDGEVNTTKSLHTEHHTADQCSSPRDDHSDAKEKCNDFK